MRRTRSSLLCGGRQQNDGVCIHMDEDINNVWPAGIGKTDDQERILGAEDLAVYRHPCSGEVDSEQGCAGVCLRCERACPT